MLKRACGITAITVALQASNLGSIPNRSTKENNMSMFDLIIIILSRAVFPAIFLLSVAYFIDKRDKSRRKK